MADVDHGDLPAGRLSRLASARNRVVYPFERSVGGRRLHRQRIDCGFLFQHKFYDQLSRNPMDADQ
jgi:hypothetical protein